MRPSLSATPLRWFIPPAGNIGGGGFMNVRLADGRTTFLDFREKAPLAATETMYQDASGKVVPGLSTDGWLAVGVPGSVAGFETALHEYGSLTRQQVMAPAIKLAREGFILGQGDVALLHEGTEGFRQDPAAAKIFLKDGKPYEVGDRLVQTDLAKTLERDQQGRRRCVLSRRDRRQHCRGEPRRRRHLPEGGFRTLQGARDEAGGMQLSRL